MTDKIEKESTNHGYVESLPCVYINKMSMIVNIQTVKRKLHKDKKYVNIVLLCKTSDFSGMNWRRR